MSRVFVSHSSRDNALAQRVRGWLADAGHQVFLDQDRRDGIVVGEEWERRLHAELRRADAMVCVVTSAYVASRWCTAEVAVARSRGCRVLPVLAEPGVTHELLTAVQYVSLADAPRVLPDALLRAGVVGWPDGKSPYPGLAAFEADMRPAFFGRERELDELLKRIRQVPDGRVLLLVGPSGSGKSSVVRAGLLPAIGEEPGWWRLEPIVPRGDPVAALERELAAAAAETRLGWELGDVRRELAANGLAGVADELLLAAPGGRARRLLIVVDQFEELLNAAPPTERARFAALLAPALTGPVQVVATLRSEFLDGVLADAELAALPASLHPLSPLGREALRTVIRRPAELAGIAIADDLVDELVADTEGGEALPLLAFTLHGLATGVGRGGELTRARYHELGGVRGALSRQAEAALAKAVGTALPDDILDALLELAAVDEHTRIVRRRVRRDALPDLSAFVDERLVVTDAPGGRADPTVYVEVVHEAFLTEWEPLAQRIEKRTVALRARRSVEMAAEQWKQGGPLWERQQLESAVAALDFKRRRTAQVGLSDYAATFLRAGLRRDRIRRTRAVAILSALLAVAVVAAVVAVAQQRSALRNQRLAVARQLVAQADAIRPTDPQGGLLLGVAADRIEPGAGNRASLAAGLLATPYAGTLTGHTRELYGTAARPDGKLLATLAGDTRLILWDLTAAGPPRPAAAPLTPDRNTDEEFSPPMAFSPDGRLLAVSMYQGGVTLFDVSDPAAPRRLPGKLPTASGNSTSRLAFAPQGRILAVAGSKTATMVVWSLADPARPVALGKPIAIGRFSYLLSFDRTGRWLIYGGADTDTRNAVRIWDLADPAAPVARPKLIYDRAAAFHQATGLLAVNSTDSFSTTAYLWDLTDPGRPRRTADLSAPAPAGFLGELFFAADGAHLAVEGDTNDLSLVRIYDLADRNDPRPLEEPEPEPGSSGVAYSTGPQTYVREAKLHSVTFLPGRPAVAVVAGDDNVITVWDYSDPTRPQRTGQPISGTSGLQKVVTILPDGSRALTGRADGTIPAWDLTGSGTPHPAGPPIGGDAHTTGLAFRDEHTLVVGRSDGSVTAWDLRSPAPRPAGVPRLADGSDQNVYLAPGGTVAAVARKGGTVEVADLTDPARHTEISQPLFPGKGGSGGIGQMVFARSGRQLIIPVGSWGTYLSLWDVADPAAARRLGDHLEARDIGDAVAFAPDGRWLAYTQGFGATPAALLVDLRDPGDPRLTGKPLTGHTDDLRALAFAPTGRLLASGAADRSVILWDVTDPARPVRLGRPLTGPNDYVSALAFTPDGRVLLAATAAGEIFLWDVEDPTQPTQLGLPITTGRDETITALALSPDGRTLAFGAPGNTVVRWDLTGLYRLLDDPAAVACARTGRGLDRVEWDRYITGLPYRNIC